MVAHDAKAKNVHKVKRGMGANDLKKLFLLPTAQIKFAAHRARHHMIL